MNVTPIRCVQTDIGAASADVPLREKVYPGISPAYAARNAARE